MPDYRSRTSTHGRNMAGARGLWRATGMKDEDFGKPIIAIANSFTQFVPGHVHLKDLGQLVAREIEKAGGVAKEFNTIAIDDGIAMGHGGMLYSLPSRELIADSVEYMVNAHCADALVCISNCDKITPGMLMAALRLNIPAIFVSGGPMEAGKVTVKGKTLAVDLIDAMIKGADKTVSDEEALAYERGSCPTCGSCSGMFTANSMNCLTEALGLALPGNGTLVATHADRKELFLEAGRRIVDAGQALLRAGRRKRAAALHRELRGVRERHDARHRHGRLDQHGAASAGGGGGRRRCLHHGRYRPAVAAHALPLQGRAEQERRASGGRAPGWRHHGDPRRTRPRGPHPPRVRHRACVEPWSEALDELGYRPDRKWARSASNFISRRRAACGQRRLSASQSAMTRSTSTAAKGVIRSAGKRLLEGWRARGACTAISRPTAAS